MSRRGRLGALGFGGATFAAVLGFGVAATPGEDAIAETPAPAAALARIGAKNEDAAATHRRALDARAEQAATGL